MPKTFVRIPASLLKHYLDTGEPCEKLDEALSRTLEAIETNKTVDEIPIEAFVVNDLDEEEGEDEDA